MKRLFIACLSIWALIALPGLAVAGSDEAAIARTIMESGRALTNLLQTKNPQEVLRFYTEDYSSILDGVVNNRKLMEMSLGVISEDAKGGLLETTTTKISNIRAMAFTGMGWATYDEFIDIHSPEVVLVKGDLKCTGLLRKIGSEWKIQHEHCSSRRDQSGNARTE
ncbi:MAG: nuclear transport factor 2 family protein [Nitrospira sp.]